MALYTGRIFNSFALNRKKQSVVKQNFRKMELRALISSHYKNLRIIFFSSNFGGLARNLDLLLFSPDASLWINLGITVLQTNNDPLIKKDDETFILTSLINNHTQWWNLKKHLFFAKKKKKKKKNTIQKKRLFITNHTCFFSHKVTKTDIF